MAEPKPLSYLIQREQKRLWSSCPQLGMQALWVEAAGPDIAAHSEVSSFKNGRLTVSCSSGAWACELKMHGTSLKAKINALRPPEEVQEIRFLNRAAAPWKSRK